MSKRESLKRDTGSQGGFQIMLQTFVKEVCDLWYKQCGQSCQNTTGCSSTPRRKPFDCWKKVFIELTLSEREKLCVSLGEKMYWWHYIYAAEQARCKAVMASVRMLTNWSCYMCAELTQCHWTSLMDWKKMKLKKYYFGMWLLFTIWYIFTQTMITTILLRRAKQTVVRVPPVEKGFGCFLPWWGTANNANKTDAVALDLESSTGHGHEFAPHQPEGVGVEGRAALIYLMFL